MIRSKIAKNSADAYVHENRKDSAGFSIIEGHLNFRGPCVSKYVSPS